MDAGQATKQKAYQAIEELPPEGLEELARFLEFLKSKYRAQQPCQVLVLGGLWKDLSFDVSDADVRALRQQVTTQLLRKV